MSQQINGPEITRQAGEDLIAFRRVKISGSTVMYQDAGDQGIGVVQAAVDYSENANACIRLDSVAGTSKMMVSGAISAGANVYPDDDGKITATINGTCIGKALEAATADGDIIEVLPYVEDAVYTNTVTITAAEMKALAATQKELIPAPGADKYIEVLGITAILDYGSEVLAEPSAPDDLEVVYDAAGGTSIADIIGDWVIQAADSITSPAIKDLGVVAATTIVNKAVVLDNTGGEYTGNATGDTVVTFKMVYKIHTAGLA
jgi:hypothetical protein